MGLFDRFRRRTNDSDATPRCDHYGFAHVVLRDAAFADPVACVRALVSGDSEQYLLTLWDGVRHLCQERGELEHISPSDLLIHKLRIGDFPCALIELPTPIASTEAFFVALVLSVDLRNQSQIDPVPALRYFVLEHAGRSLIGREIATRVSEWQADAERIDRGTGPSPSLENFVRVVTQQVIQQRLT